MPFDVLKKFSHTPSYPHCAFVIITKVLINRALAMWQEVQVEHFQIPKGSPLMCNQEKKMQGIEKPECRRKMKGDTTMR